MEVGEKDKDVKEYLKVKLKEAKAPVTSSKQEALLEEKRKVEEENRINQGKSVINPTPRGGTGK